MQIAYATAEDRRTIEQIDSRYFRLQSPGEGAARADPEWSSEEYIVASVSGEVVGYVGISGPGSEYPIESHFRRDQLPMAFDEGLFEVRVVVVGTEGPIEHPALALAYAALRSVENRDGTHLVIIARTDLIPFFRKLGLVALEHRLHAGVVEFEVMHASVRVLRQRSRALGPQLELLRATTDWRLPFPFEPATA